RRVRRDRAPRAHAAPAGSDRRDPRSGPPPPRRRAPPPCAGLPRTGLRPPRPPASARRRAPPCGGGRRGAATRRDRGSRSFSWRRGFYATGPPRSRRAPRAAISPQQILDLLEEAAPARMHLLARLAREFFEQLALALGQRGRRLHDHAHPLIAAGAVAVQRGDALAPQAEDLAALRAGRDDHLDLAVEGGHLHRGAECGLGEADGNLAVDVAIVPDEDRVLLHLEDHVKVAGDAAGRSRLALALEREPGAGVDPGRHLHVHLGAARHLSRAPAFRTLVHDHRALPLAGGAGAGDGEKALREALRPAPAADAAGLGARPRPRAAPAAGVAAAGPRILDLQLRAEGRLLQRDPAVHAQVGAAGPGGGPPACAPAEDLREDVAEDVAETAEALEVETAEALAEGIARVPEAVVLGPLLRIGEAGV